MRPLPLQHDIERKALVSFMFLRPFMRQRLALGCVAVAVTLVPPGLYMLGHPQAAVLGILAGVFAAFFVLRGVAGPLFSLNGALLRLAMGEIGAVIPGLHRKDELGDMARAVQRIKDSLIEKHDLAAKVSKFEVTLERFRAVWRAAPDPVIFLDREGLIHEVSNAALHVFGYAPEEIVRWPIEALIPGIFGAHHADVSPFANGVNAARRIGMGREFAAIAKDGSEVPVEATFVPIVSDGVTLMAVIIHDISIRKIAEAELGRNEQLLTAAQRLARMGSWDIDLKTNIVQRSAELLRIFEREHEEPRAFLEQAQASMHQKIHPYDRERYQRFVARITSSGGVRSTEHRIVMKDGSIRHIRINCHGVVDESGKLVRVIGASQDVTAEKEIQDNLRRNEQRLSEAQRMANVGSWELVPEINYMHWSEGLYALFEVTPETFKVTPANAERIVAEHVHPDDIALVQAALRSSVGANPLELEHRMIMPDGRLKYILSRIYHEQDSEGRLVRSMGVVQDVTARHLAKQEIQKREAQLRLITNSLPVSITYLDVDETVLFINQTGAQWYEREPAEIIGRVLVELVDLEEYEIFKPLRERAFLGETIQDEREVEFHNGTQRWLEFQFLPDFSPSGVIRGLYVLISDIDDRKRMERKLAQAQKMEAIGQLTGGIAHDFNNILTVIRGNLQLVGMTSDKKKAEERVHRAIAACGQAGDLVSRLLTFARQQELRPKAVSVGDLVRNITKLLRSTMIENVDIKTALPLRPVWVQADPSQLESALVNLCLNARDAMPQGGSIAITVDTCDGAPGFRGPGGAYVRIAVSDTGVGMSEEIKQRVLEPFFTTKDFGKGSGLGLSMVHGFVEQSGGSLRIESEIGRGTCIYLYLPECRPANGERDLRMEKAIESMGAHTILVVEDRMELREMVVTFLRGVGYHIVEASNGAEALSLIETSGPLDLLFTDIVMPGGMNGAELARQAKAMSPRMRVLYTTGYVRSDDAAALGEDVLVLKKPYALSELAEVVAQALKKAA